MPVAGGPSTKIFVSMDRTLYRSTNGGISFVAMAVFADFITALHAPVDGRLWLATGALLGNNRNYRVRFSTRAWPGDDVICRGTVTRKLEQGGEKLVEGELEAVNQRGETLISGSFTAALPSRG